jgi:hypothetical protein
VVLAAHEISPFSNLFEPFSITVHNTQEIRKLSGVLSLTLM